MSRLSSEEPRGRRRGPPDARKVEPAGLASNVQDPAFEMIGMTSEPPGRTGSESPRERRRRLLQQRRQMRVDPKQIDAPTFDQKKSRINQLVTGAGAVGSLVAALGGSEVGAAAGAGLATGGAENLRRQRESFRRRQQAFRKQLQSVRSQNREVALSTNEALVRGAEQQIERNAEQEANRIEQKRKKELIRLRNRLENKLSPQEKQKVQSELDLLDQRIEARKALTTERRTQAEANRALAEKRRRTGGEEGEGRPSKAELNRQLVETGRAMSTTATQMEAARQKLSEMENSEMVDTDSRRDLVRDRIGRLQEKLDGLQREQARITAQINQRGGAEGETPQDGQSIPERQFTENRETFVDTLPPGMRPGAGDADGNQQGRQSPARDTTRRGAPGQQLRSQGRGDGGQSGSDPIRQEARQQAAKMDTVTQADIDNAVEEFGVGSSEVRILREVRRIQQSQ